MKKIKKWQLLEETDVSPSSWFPLYKHKVRLANGKIVEDYYISKLGDVAMVVPITSNNEMVFVRQYKHGARELIIELPAGRIKSVLEPKDVAKEELREETGYVANNLIELGAIYGSPSKDALRVFGYLAKDLSVRVEQYLDDNEEIEVVLIPLNKVDGRIKKGEIMASDTIAFIKLAQLKHPDIFR